MRAEETGDACDQNLDGQILRSSYRTRTIFGMATKKEDVHVQIERVIMVGVRSWASQHGVSVAAAMSVLLTKALDAEQRERPALTRGLDTVRRDET